MKNFLVVLLALCSSLAFGVDIVRAGGGGSASAASVYAAYGATSTAFPLNTAGYADQEYAQMTGNSITLPAGTYIISGEVWNDLTDTNARIYDLKARIYTANGNNTTTIPAVVTATAGTNNEVMAGGNGITAYPAFSVHVGPFEATFASSTTIYIVPRTQFTTAGAATMKAYIFAERRL